MRRAEARATALGLSTLRLFTGKPLTKNIDWYHRRGYVTDREEELTHGGLGPWLVDRATHGEVVVGVLRLRARHGRPRAPR